MVEFTNRILKDYPMVMITCSNDYSMSKGIAQSILKLNIPTLKWSIIERDGIIRFTEAKQISNAI